MPYIAEINRYQVEMLSLDMQVDQDSTARIIDVFVDSLDLDSLGFKHATPSKEGRPAYPPASMLKLYIYGHRNNIRSSRRLQRACHVNIELKWLMKGAEPDFRTISDFRKDHCDKLKSIFLEFNKRFSDLMTGYYSVDGSKFNASNSKDNNFTSNKLDDRIEWLKEHIAEFLRQMDQKDKEEEASGTLTAEELERKLKDARERLEKYQSYREYMEQNNLSQISLSDIDSRLMKNRNGFSVSHNTQTAVESNTHMIADYQVTSSPTDYGQLESTLHELKKDNPDKVIEATADKGYQSEEDMAKCLENGIKPHVNLPDGQDTYEVNIPHEEAEETNPESTDPEEISKCLHAGIIPDAYKDVIESAVVSEKDVRVVDETDEVPQSPFQDDEEMKEKAAEGFFVRDPVSNKVICPAGETLRQSYVTKQDKIRYTNKFACKNCPYIDKCYHGKKGFKEVDFYKDEFIKPNGNWMKASGQEPVFTKRNIKREKRKIVTLILRPDREKLANRMCLSEHPFGTIKRAMDSSYFLLRGNGKITGEFALFSIGYNLQRAINLLGFEEVMRRMSSYFYLFFRFLLISAENTQLAS